jgi:molecular chaperone GrpE
MSQDFPPRDSRQDDAPGAEPSDAATPAADATPGADSAAEADTVAHGADSADPRAVDPAPDAESADESAQTPDFEMLADADPRTKGQMLEALVAATGRRDEYLDDLRRKQAEFENFRKRMMRDGATQRILGHAEVAERLLDVLDDFDRTLAAAGDDVEPGFFKGVTLVHDKLMAVLTDFGLSRIDASGVEFDPNRHEAVQQRPADDDVGDAPRVHQVLRPGYALGGRVLRAAMVVVEQ